MGQKYYQEILKFQNFYNDKVSLPDNFRCLEANEYSSLEKLKLLSIENLYRFKTKRIVLKNVINSFCLGKDSLDEVKSKRITDDHVINSLCRLNIINGYPGIKDYFPSLSLEEIILKTKNEFKFYFLGVIDINVNFKSFLMLINGPEKYNITSRDLILINAFKNEITSITFLAIYFSFEDDFFYKYSFLKSDKTFEIGEHKLSNIDYPKNLREKEKEKLGVLEKKVKFRFDKCGYLEIIK